MKKIIIQLIVVAIFGFVFTGRVDAGIGISPPTILNQNLKPGAVLEETIVLSQSDPTEELLVTIEPDLGEINNWITFEPSQQFTVPVGQQRYSFKIIVNVPADAELKPYDGYIRIKASPTTEAAPGGVAVVKGARMEVNLLTTDLDFTNLVVRKIDLADVPDGESIALEMLVENNGNVAAAPNRVEIDIQDLNQNSLQILETNDIENVEPNQTATIFAYLDGYTVKPGEYFAVTKVFLNDDLLREERLVFRILGEGEVEEIVISQDENTLTDRFGEENLALTFFLIVFLGGVSIVFFVLFIKSTKKKETLREKEKLSLGFILAFILLAIVVTVVINYDQIFNYTNDSGAEVELLDEAEADVAGLNDENIPPLQVKPSADTITYNLYADPDESSDIVHVATQGEKFKVLDETEEWYQVRVNTTVVGWLSKNTVVESVVEDI